MEPSSSFPTAGKWEAEKEAEKGGVVIGNHWNGAELDLLGSRAFAVLVISALWSRGMGGS